jgi:hypothetical protein
MIAMDVKRLVGICFLFISACVYGQANFSTVLDQNTVARNDVLLVEYVVENAKKVERFDPPSFRNFTVVQGPIESSGMSMINGNLIQYKSLGFLLQPRKTGRLIIPGATATIDGKRRQSEAVAVEVTAGNSSQGGVTSSQPRLRFNLPDERVEADREFVLYPNEKASDKIKSNLFVKVEVNKKTCYVNEPVVATYKLYSRLRSESRVVKRPSFNGFSVYDMIDPEGSNPSIETLNGKQYNVHVIRKSQLFPLQAGDFTLDPVEVENTVRFIKASSEQDTYLEEIDDPFAETVEHTLTIGSEPVSITVKPLPSAKQPADFDGAVGNFTVEASLKNPVIKAGEAASLELQIKGKGNIPMINAPDIPWTTGVEAYDPQAKEEVHAEEAPLSGVKTFQYTFTARDTGNMVIPPVRFSFFDPASQSYKTASTDGISLRVMPAGKKQSKVAVAGKKIISNLSAKNIWLWMGAGTVVTLGIIALVMYRGRKRPKRPAASTLAPTTAPAEPVAVRPDPLEKARRLALIESPRVFVKEVESVIWSEASEKLNIPLVALNQQEVVIRLRQRGASESVISNFRQLMHDCESALYIPGQDSENFEEILRKAEAFLKSIE